MPLVSVVTPVRNARKWLPRCLDSVAAQSYPRVEHVVVDGASEDGSQDYLRTRAELRWVSERDSGQSSAINKGMRLARGSVLTWLNADDELPPDAIARAVDLLQRHRAQWVVGTGELREAGRVWRQAPPRRLRPRHFDLRNPVCQPAAFFTRQLWEAVGGVDEDLHLTMDLDLWLRFLARGALPATTQDVLAVVTVHDEAKTRAVSAEAWSREFGETRVRNGRIRAGAVDLGRAAAERANRGGHTGARGTPTTPPPGVPRVPFRAGWHLRSAQLATGWPQRAAHLARLEPWLCPQTLDELRMALSSRLLARRA